MDVKQCFLILILAACVPATSKAQTVTYNYAQGVNFAFFKTYEWLNISGGGTSDPVLDKNIRAAIDAQLASEGLIKSHDRAQLLIAYQAGIAREEQIGMFEGYQEYGLGWSHGPGYGYSHGYSFDCPYSLSTETGSTIQIGHLVLDIYDAAYRDLVWRGRVSQAISFTGEQDKRQQRLNKAVAKLFRTYPRKPRG